MSSDLHHLGAAYALNALEPHERRSYEGHYPTCDICAAEVSAFRETAAELAAAVAAEPPTDLKAAVMAEIGSTRQMSPSTGPRDELAARRGMGRALPAVAALIALVVGLAAGLLLQRDSGSGVDSVLAADDVVLVDLAGEAGTVLLAWSADRGEVAVVATGLPELASGLGYQLWLIDDDGVVPSRVLEVSSGAVSAAFGAPEGVPLAWGITVEPLAGSNEPTTPVLYVGEV